VSERLLIDTTILVDYLRGLEEAAAVLEQRQMSLLLSTVVVAELYAGVRDSEREQLATALSAFRVCPVTEEIARRGGLMKRDYGPSHGTGLADALIAATAQDTEATLVTLNERHFPMLGDIRVPY
jgi:predicted nucleic acid-binding protein